MVLSSAHAQSAPYQSVQHGVSEEMVAELPRIHATTLLLHKNRPLSNYASVPVNNNLKSRLRARKYSKCIKTWHEASTSGSCSRELKRNSKAAYLGPVYTAQTNLG